MLKTSWWASSADPADAARALVAHVKKSPGPLRLLVGDDVPEQVAAALAARRDDYGERSGSPGKFSAEQLARRVVRRDPTARWLFVVDNLTTHCSETLVRWVARLEGFEGDLGKKGRTGILENVETRRAFLVDVSHRVRSSRKPASRLHRLLQPRPREALPLDLHRAAAGHLVHAPQVGDQRAKAFDRVVVFSVDLAH